MDDSFGENGNGISPELLEVLGVEDFTVQRDYGQDKGFVLAVFMLSIVKKCS
jgi:hypothetical protein